MTRPLAIAQAALLALVLAGCSAGGSSSEVSDAGGAGAKGQQEDLNVLEIGDCLNDPTSSGVITDYTLVDCSLPHDSEVYESIPMNDATYPGKAAVHARAVAGCEKAFATFVGIPFSDSTLAIETYEPIAKGWGWKDSIECLIKDTDAAGNPVKSSGSLKSAKR